MVNKRQKRIIHVCDRPRKYATRSLKEKQAIERYYPNFRIKREFRSSKFFKGNLEYLLYSPSADLLHIHAQRLLPMLLWRTKIPTILDYHDLPAWDLFESKVENYCLKHAKRIICTSNVQADYLEEKGYHSNVIYNVCDTKHFKPKEWEKRYTAIYIGRNPSWELLQTLTKTFKILNETFKDAKLLIMGEKSLKTPYIDYIGLQPYSKIVDFINMASIGLVLKNPSNPVPFASCPHKLWEYWACKKIVISTKIGITKKFSSAVHLTDLNPKSITEAISYLLTEEKEASKISNEGFKIAQRYDLKWMSNSLQNIYLKAT